MRKLIGGLVVAATLVGAPACGGSEGDGTSASGCPDGAARMESTDGSAGEVVDSREAAIQAELETLGYEASDDAIAEGVVGSSPTQDGAETVQVQSSGGVVTMTLVPQLPGWRVERSTWCGSDQG